MTGQFEFEPAYYLASILRYVSQDGQYYVVGPIWECVRQIGGKKHFPVIVSGKRIEGRVYWCSEVSHDASDNFEVASENGDFRLVDNLLHLSDETTPEAYVDFVSGGTTNRVALEKLEC